MKGGVAIIRTSTNALGAYLFSLWNKAIRMTDQPDSEGKKVVDKSLGKAREGYQSINEKLALGKEDSVPVLIGKVILRILLIIVMILLSPFLLVGLILAMIAAL